MLKITNKSQSSRGDGETSEPLLGQGHDRTVDDSVIFSVDDEEEHGILYDRSTYKDDEHHHSQPKRSVRFQEEVRVIGPSLRSTMQSREAGELCSF